MAKAREQGEHLHITVIWSVRETIYTQAGNGFELVKTTFSANLRGAALKMARMPWKGRSWDVQVLR